MNLTQWISFSFLLLFSVSTCNEDIDCTPLETQFNSDYFVFIANDGGTPLVVPFDLNWNPTDNGYTKEFKSWYGTINEWPITYIKENVTIDECNVPVDIWSHPNEDEFVFDKQARTISLTVPNSPEIIVNIPSMWTTVNDASALPIQTEAAQTTILVDGQERSGWMVHEIIRALPADLFGGDFTYYFWVPLVTESGDLYLFEQEEEKRKGYKWSKDNNIVTSSVANNFTITALTTTTDPISGRTNIPQSLQLISTDWNLDITLNSSGAQIGHGSEFPNGLAYYRQSLLTSTAKSSHQATGMLELILEDD